MSNRPPKGLSGLHRRPLVGVLGLLCLTGQGCSSDPTGAAFENDQGINAAALESVYSEIRALPGSFSLLVQRNGVLVAEEYFNGFTPDSLHDVRSVTKSVISIRHFLMMSSGLGAGGGAVVRGHPTPGRRNPAGGALRKLCTRRGAVGFQFGMVHLSPWPTIRPSA